MADVFLTTTISGGLILLLWYLSYPISKRVFNSAWHYIVIKISMLFLVFPVCIFVSLLGSVHKSMPDDFSILINNQAINAMTTVNGFSPWYENIKALLLHIQEFVNAHIWYLAALWAIVSFSISIVEIFKLQGCKKRIKQLSHTNTDCVTNDIFLSCKKQLDIRQKVGLMSSEYVSTPFVFGILKPTIVLPLMNMTTNETRLTLIHELTHIKNGDLLFKLIARIISIVHWFNPIVHLLVKSVGLVSEIHCDECIVITMANAERKSYGELILKFVSNIPTRQSRVFALLSTPERSIRGRLHNIMYIKKSKKRILVLSIIVALLFFLSGITYMVIANASTVEDETVANPESTYTMGVGVYTRTQNTDSALLSEEPGITEGMLH